MLNRASDRSVTLGGWSDGSCWTDGKKHPLPDLPDRPCLVKCPQCTRLCWLDEAKWIAKLERIFEKTDVFVHAQEYEISQEIEYLCYLEHTDLTPEKERYVRIRAWWCANDRRRHRDRSDATDTSFSRDQHKNVSVLYGLINEEEPGQ